MIAVAIAVIVGSVIVGSVLRNRVDPAQEQSIAAGGRPEPAITTADQIAVLQGRVALDASDTRSAIDLGASYLQMVRESGDPSYYGKSEALLSDVLAREPGNAEAMAWLGGLDLARHEFASALTWGQQALAAQDDLLIAFPVVIDAFIELGRYDEAIETSDAFIQLRPDLPSYTRVSYIRELHGNRGGAISAMGLALDSTRFGTEPSSWTRVQLGNLHFYGGNLVRAEEEYTFTLATYPDYAPALAGMARIAAANGDLPRAAELLVEASTRIPIPEYVILLGDVYAAMGETERAEEQYALVRVMTQLLESNGVNSDLELALFAADHPSADATPEQVVAMAREAFAVRPGIYGHDVLAWALYQAGDYDGAWTEMQQALRLGTQDALLYFHAGAIAQARGDDETAREYLTTALKINPDFSILYADEATAMLADLAP